MHNQTNILVLNVHTLDTNTYANRNKSFFLTSKINIPFLSSFRAFSSNKALLYELYSFFCNDPFSILTLDFPESAIV